MLTIYWYRKLAETEGEVIGRWSIKNEKERKGLLWLNQNEGRSVRRAYYKKWRACERN